MTDILYPFMATCVVVAVGLATASADVAKKSASQGADNSSLYRLPKSVVPDFYDILLLTNVTRSDFQYQGEVTIELRVLKKTRQVILHTEKLNIIEKKSMMRRSLSSKDYQTIAIKSQHGNNETQFHIITFFEDLPPGKYLLSLYFQGQVLDDIFGFYRSSYRLNNETRWLGMTQFSPTFARRAFPCFDEPGFKAVFQLRLGHYGNETVTSNTFAESKTVTARADYFITKFAKTPPMSTYILGWAIHDFHRVNTTYRRFPLWTRFKDSELPQPLASLAEGPRMFAALEDYTSLSNPLGKLEQFAVPDFKFLGMENWGLITYRESVPLSSEQQSPTKSVHDYLVTVGHEYAHSWYGNLVTPTFWDVAWLKEGFATYFSYVCMDMTHESWRAMNLFSLEVLQLSLLSDSEKHNRTMNGRNVGSPKSAKAVLDFVTYKKGASIIRMVADVMGDKLFQDAMRSYLKEYKYEAVTPSDLYKHLERAYNSSKQPSALSIGNVIETWANQPNYPLIRASRVAPGQIIVTQEVFKLNRNSTRKNHTLWLVPIKIAGVTRQRKLGQVSSWHGRYPSSAIVLPDDLRESSWYIVNPWQIGYYRVDYDESNWKALKKLLLLDNYQDLPVTARAALLDDVFNLARAGYKNYEVALDLAKYLTREIEYEPWVAACRAILFLNDKLKERLEVQLAFRRYAIDLIRPIYEQLSFNEHPAESRIKKMHRNLILSTACSLNFVDCVSHAKSIFNDWIDDKKKTVPANLKDFVYHVGIRYGTNDDWNKLWQRFLKTELYPEKEIMITALASTSNYDVIDKYLEFSIQPASNIQNQYRWTIVQSIINGNRENIDHVLRYLDENLQKITKLKGISFVEDILITVGAGITSPERKNMLTLFVDKNSQKLEKALDAGKKAIKIATDNIAWVNDCALQLDRYFN